MTAAVLPAGTVPLRPAWRSLLWLIPLSVLWIALIAWQPMIPDSGVPTSAHQLAAHGLIALGLWLGLERTDLSPRRRLTMWLAIMVPYTLWFAIAWSAAVNGVFVTGTSRVPFLPLAIFLPVIIGAPILLLSQSVGQVLDAMPAAWLVALQVYRVFGIWAFVASLRGVLTAVAGMPAGIGDLLTGLFALPAAIGVAAGTAEGRRTAIVWNLFGLADFAIALTMGMITAPGRFQLIVPSLPSLNPGIYPGVLTPVFVVPSSILLHALSLRQLRRRGQADARRRQADQNSGPAGTRNQRSAAQ
jgi:hypothetical protein